MNDEFGKTAQDVKIDKMSEDIRHLFLGVNELARESQGNDKQMVDLLRDYNSCMNDIDEMQEKLRSLFKNVDALTKEVANLLK